MNLGAGIAPRRGWVNLDVAPLPGIDVVWDLDTAPWPFKDCEADEVMAQDVFEHVDRPVLFVTEMHRILRPGGLAHIQTSYYLEIDAYTDPTHKRFPTEHTFDYWIPGKILHRHNPAYGGVSFDLVQWWLENGQQHFQLRKLPLNP